MYNKCMENNIKKRLCPICGFAGNDNGLVINFDKRIGTHRISIDRCEKCDFTYQSPLLDGKLRDKIYENKFIGNDNKQKEYIKLMNHRRFGLAEEFSRFVSDNQNVVEIGCSSGFILNKMSEYKKCKFYGFDLDKDAINFGKKVFKNLILSSEDFFSETMKFDVVVLSHILEHIDYPLLFIEEIKKHLTTNGKIIIGVPNSKNMFEKPFWEHTNYFSATSLFEIAKRINMSVEYAKEWTTKNGEQELTFVFTNKKERAKLISEIDEEKVKKSKRWGLRNWYDATPTKDKKQFEWIKREYKLVKTGRSVSEWLFWSKLYRFFVKK